MIDVLQKVSEMTPKLGDWTSTEKAHILSALTFALRPKVAVEIGVWTGASLFPVALAMKQMGHGMIHAIDPWSQQVSVTEQTTDADKRWWSSVDHDKIFNEFQQNVLQLSVGNVVQIHRCKSDDAPVPASINYLCIDGSHSDQAIRDVTRFASHVELGGIVLMDDLEWVGGGPAKGAEILTNQMGFVRMYPLGTGAVFQRLSK